MGSKVVKAPTVQRAMRRDALENRERLLAAANEAFSVHGLDASVEEIAHIAGVGMGTLYRRFPTKESLIDYMVSDLLQQMLTLGVEALKRTDGDGLEYFLRSVASLWESHQGFISRLWSASYASALYKKFDAIIDALVDQAKSAKIVRADLVASDVVVTFWAIRGIIDASHELAPGTWQRHVDIVMAGLALGTQVPSHDALSIAKRRAISATRVRH